MKFAALRGNYVMVQFLLYNGLEASEHGNCSLYVPEQKGYKEMADLLKRHGASVDALSDSDRENWEKEDRDGIDRLSLMWYSDPHGEEYPDDSEISETEITEST